MSERSEQLPRVFQANIDRLFRQVIEPILDALPVNMRVGAGHGDSFEQFLGHAQAQVANYTANETAKAFALVLAAVFERQLSIWARAIDPTCVRKGQKPPPFVYLLNTCARHAAIDLLLDGIGDAIQEMHELANVVRHGDGPACERLVTKSPKFWNSQDTQYLDLIPGEAVTSELVIVGRSELAEYTRAITRFWGLADKLPNAVVDPR